MRAASSFSSSIVLLLLLLGATSASAEQGHVLARSVSAGVPELDDDAAQIECASLWSQAEAATAARRFREAADLYARIYSDYHEECAQIGDHDLCEVLYNAAVNYESGYRIGPAIQIRQRLFNECGDESEYAEAHGGKASEWAKRAIYQIGGNYHAIGSYTKAAQYYEDFARRYPREKEAPEALQDATVFRIGLGQDDKAIENMKLFERSYAARRELKAQAASVVISIGKIFMRRKAWPAAEKHYSSFLKRYGGTARADELIRAQAELGYARWMQGEGVKLRDSSIEAFTQALILADRGAAGGETDEVRRDRYRRVIGAGGEDEADWTPSDRLSLMVEAVARARFYLGEREYERFVADALPGFEASGTLPPAVRSWYAKTHPEEARALDETLRSKDPGEQRTAIDDVRFRHWVEEEVQPWMKRKDARRAAAEKLFLAVIAEDVPEWESAAMARVGDMYRQIMEALDGVPLPPSIANDPELADVYRSQIDSLGTSYRNTAIEAYRQCLTESTKSSWYGEWSRHCEQQLNGIDPRSYPLNDEIRAESTYQYDPAVYPMVAPRMIRGIFPD